LSTPWKNIENLGKHYENHGENIEKTLRVKLRKILENSWKNLGSPWKNLE
jgi:hypothetical protein